jgi:hypothetical protein
MPKKYDTAAPIPKTKRYGIQLDAMPAQQDLNPQKGPTCWYYALLLLRTRYKPADVPATLVKLLELEDEFRKDPDYLGLLQNRAIEKEVSAYRKFCTHHADEAERMDNLSSQAKRSEDEEKELANLNFLFHSRRIVLLDNLTKLNVFSEEMCSELKEVCAVHSETFSHNFIFCVTALAYNLKLSAWSPNGVDALKKEIETKGPLTAQGAFGHSHYDVAPTKTEDTIDERPIYAWRKGERNAKKCAHVIVVIGAETIPTSGGNSQQVVFYIDPNCPDIAFQISYERFLSSITEMQTKASATHFTIHANHKLRSEENTRYQKLTEKIMVRASKIIAQPNGQDTIDTVCTQYARMDDLAGAIKTLNIEKDFKDDKDYVDLQNNRTIEKEILAYRKAQTETKRARGAKLDDSDRNQLRTQRISLIDKLAKLDVFDATQSAILQETCKKADEITSDNLINYIISLKLSKRTPEKFPQQYQNILSKLLSKITDVSYWHTEVSRVSSWGIEGRIYLKDEKNQEVKITLPKGIRNILAKIKFYAEDKHEEKDTEVKILKEIQQIAEKKLKQPSRLRSDKTNLFYREISKLDTKNAKQTLSDLAKNHPDVLRRIRFG